MAEVNWKKIDEKYPTKLDRNNMAKEEYRKLRTVELYDYLPLTTLEERATYTDIRDAVIDLNFAFFGYIASHKFVNNSYISYEDKFQSAVLHFCEMWTKYKFVPKYRGDLSFAVFFKPRITECMERELDEVKYSLRRALCMEVGQQLGKHWTKVCYEDLSNPNLKLSADKICALQAVFGSMYAADLDTHAMFIASPNLYNNEEELYSDNYDSLTDMLMHEMIERESDLSENTLNTLSQLLDVPFEVLNDLLPKAKEKLYNTLINRLEMRACSTQYKDGRCDEGEED